MLSKYYAKARMYDAGDRRFTSVDPVLNPTRYDVSAYVASPAQFVPYLYVVNNPLVWIDPLGLEYTLLQGFIAHIEIEAYIKFFHPSAHLQRRVNGTTHTKKATYGYPDVMIPVSFIERGVEVYEIKSYNYDNPQRPDLMRLADMQINSYVHAINNNPTDHLNIQYAPAKRGTQLLPELASVWLPYFDPEGKYNFIHIYTYPGNDTRSGMIYYKLYTCVPPRVKVTEFEFSQATHGKIRGFKKAFEKKKSAYNLTSLGVSVDLSAKNVYWESEGDIALWIDLVEFGKTARISTRVEYGVQLTEIWYPDNTRLYKSEGISLFGTLKPQTEVLAFEAARLYFGMSQSQDKWSGSVEEAVWKELFSSGENVIPIPLPLPAPMPIN